MTIDLRLADLWAEIFDLGDQPIDHELLGWLLRAAYGQGYTDALRETRRGQLCLDLGIACPIAPRNRGCPAPTGPMVP